MNSMGSMGQKLASGSENTRNNNANSIEMNDTREQERKSSVGAGIGMGMGVRVATSGKSSMNISTIGAGHQQPRMGSRRYEPTLMVEKPLRLEDDEEDEDDGVHVRQSQREYSQTGDLASIARGGGSGHRNNIREEGNDGEDEETLDPELQAAELQIDEELAVKQKLLKIHTLGSFHDTDEETAEELENKGEKSSHKSSSSDDEYMNTLKDIYVRTESYPPSGESGAASRIQSRGMSRGGSKKYSLAEQRLNCMDYPPQDLVMEYVLSRHTSANSKTARPIASPDCLGSEFDGVDLADIPSDGNASSDGPRRDSPRMSRPLERDINTKLCERLEELIEEDIRTRYPNLHSRLGMRSKSYSPGRNFATRNAVFPPEGPVSRRALRSQSMVPRGGLTMFNSINWDEELYEEAALGSSKHSQDSRKTSSDRSAINQEARKSSGDSAESRKNNTYDEQDFQAGSGAGVGGGGLAKGSKPISKNFGRLGAGKAVSEDATFRNVPLGPRVTISPPEGSSGQQNEYSSLRSQIDAISPDGASSDRIRESKHVSYSSSAGPRGSVRRNSVFYKNRNITPLETIKE
mmetsp:Transcript_7159/g.12864  ORF Transcript_7159/g.12864 Transcript_7159/m.12864 type:complete len:577 (-) Transcript_7159:358-2088(-)